MNWNWNGNTGEQWQKKIIILSKWHYLVSVLIS